MAVGYLRNDADIAACVDMYRSLSDESFMETSREAAIRNLSKLVRMKRFVRCIRDNDKIIAWIYADGVRLLHTDKPNFQQFYYASSVTGIKAARCVTTLHREMVAFGQLHGFHLMVSAGSHLDPEFVFARLLERDGWDRRGHCAAIKTGPGVAPRDARAPGGWLPPWPGVPDAT